MSRVLFSGWRDYVCAHIRHSTSAQVSSQPNSANESVFAHVNRQANLSRSGNSAATAELAHQLFTTASIPTDSADSLGNTQRIVQAEIAHRNGAHPAIHEADVVKAINSFATTVSAPQ